MSSASATASELTFTQGLRSSITHLRLKNTLHVAPVVLFAISQSMHTLDVTRTIATVAILHLLIFPSSVGYNSYYDRDDAPTGGLEAPPPVHESLYWLCTGLDVVALIGAYLVGLPFFVFIVITIVASRMYSHDKIRVKGYPVFGHIWVSFFQGAYSYVMVLAGILADPSAMLDAVFTGPILLPALFSTALVAGSYPLSQVYQFDEDAARGDTTIAMVLGYRGTFLFAQTVLSAGWLVVAAYFALYSSLMHLAILTGLFLAPAGFVAWWFKQVRLDTKNANHKNAMTMAALAGGSGSLCFVILAVLNAYGIG